MVGIMIYSYSLGGRIRELTMVKWEEGREMTRLSGRKKGNDYVLVGGRKGKDYG